MDNSICENIRNDRFAKYLGMNLLEVRPGYAKVEMEITEGVADILCRWTFA